MLDWEFQLFQAGSRLSGMPLFEHRSDLQAGNVIKIGLGLCLIGYIAYVCWPFCLKAPAPDESTFLYQGLIVSEGKVPYRDFFDFIWPATFYLIALLIKLCGGLSMVAVRIFSIAILFACGTLTWLMGRAYMPFRWLCFMAGLFWTLHFPSSVQMQHHLMSGFMGLLAVFILWQHIGEPVIPRKRLIATGVCLGVCMLFTQSLGAILILCVSGVLFARLRADGAASIRTGMPVFLGAIVAPIVITLIYLGLNQALGEFAYSSATWLFQGGYIDTSTHRYFYDLFPMLRSYFYTPVMPVTGYLSFLLCLAYLVLPLLGLSWGVFYGNRVFRNESIQPRHWQWFLLFWTTLGFLLATFSHSSIFHIAYNGWTAFMLGCGVLASLLKRYPKLEISILTVFFLAIFSFSTMQLQSAIGMYSSPTVRSYGTLEKQLYWLQDVANTRDADQMIEAIHQLSPPGESLFVYNLAPEFYILTDRRNPTRYQLLMTTLDTPAQIAEASEELARKMPRFVLYNHQDERFFLQDPRFQALKGVNYHLSAIEALLKSHYSLFGKDASYDLYIENNAFETLKSTSH